MIELVLVLWFVITFVCLLVKYVGEALIAAWRGTTPPRLARKAARDKLRRKYGTPTVGQVLAERLAHRIAHPPERRWAAKAREVLAEIVEDALCEAQIRHQRAHRARQQARARQDGFWVQTGSGQYRTNSPPPPDPDDDVTDTYPCIAGCGTGYVSDPDDMCDACAADLAPPDPGPDTEPIPPVNNDDPTPDEGDPMSQTHYIDTDIHDPRSALSAALQSRALNEAIVGELDILAANLTRAGVGAGPVGQVRVLSDAARTYSQSNQRSAEAYAEHVVIQADLAGDDELRDTVQGTYLDTRGGDVRSVPRQGGKSTINAADCHDPVAAARLMDSIAVVYQQMQVGVDQAKGNQEAQGVTDEPIAFLAEQLEYATIIAGQAARSAVSFRAHVATRNDTVGSNRSVAGTQAGRYLDTSRA